MAVAEPASVAYAPVKRRSEEVLFAGNNIVKTEIKIYPNPYFEKASLEINLEKATTVSVDVTSESGTLVANLLPQRQLSPGYYRIEVPDVSPGIYFVKCNFGNHSEVRRVVKVARQ